VLFIDSPLRARKRRRKEARVLRTNLQEEEEEEEVHPPPPSSSHFTHKNFPQQGAKACASGRASKIRITKPNSLPPTLQPLGNKIITRSSGFYYYAITVLYPKTVHIQELTHHRQMEGGRPFKIGASQNQRAISKIRVEKRMISYSDFVRTQRKGRKKVR
jgi:hypothetical protein